MAVLGARFLRGPRWRQHQPVFRRAYSVHIQTGTSHQVKTIADLKELHPSQPVSDVQVCGWVRSVRRSACNVFVDVTDGSSMRPIQAVVDKSLASEIRPGSAVRLIGNWSQGSVTKLGEPISFTGELTNPTMASNELQVCHVDVSGTSDPKTYPIQNKYQTPESLRTVPHLRSRTPLNSTLLRFRSDAIALLTQFFFGEQFQQTHPPIITSSNSEGSCEAFTIRSDGKEPHFFRDAKFLTVSTQLHLESLAQALGNVWTLSPTFRAEKSDTSRHLSEFQMLEAEMSFVDMDDIIKLAQRMLVSLTTGLVGRRAAKELKSNRDDSKEPAERLAFNDLEDAEVLSRRWRGMMTAQSWPRITYTEAIEALEAAKDEFEHKPVWGLGLQSEHERYLAEKVGYEATNDAYLPVFITHYPREAKAFYMLQSADSPAEGQTVDCFDLLVPGLGELAGGSMREHRLPELEEGMKLHGLQVPTARRQGPGSKDLGWYVDMRRWGCPPHGGFGLGFDRLLSYLTGVTNVRDVVPFPRHFGRCDC